MRRQARFMFFVCITLLILFVIQNPNAWWFTFPAIILLVIGVNDYFQKRHAVRRNFPLIGHFRYIFESIRPEINQYFIESSIDGTPFSREMRSVVYQRAKSQLDSVPFGTKHDLYNPGHETIRHSMFPTQVPVSSLTVNFGNSQCEKPYQSSLFSISAMSFGALSGRAVEALNAGARMGHFAHSSGEGGISSHHLKHGGDLIWQIGTGYFGCRNMEGKFDEQRFATTSQRPEVKMIEIKLSQGAKPGLGGMLPASKVSHEIAMARGVPLGKDVASPARHSAFNSCAELLEFVKKLRLLSGGKPVGIKLCLGKTEEFDELCETMVRLEIFPDFITVDGAEGGTGAAPIEFTNHVGVPLTDAIVYVHRTLAQYGIRNQMKIVASGRILSGFDIARVIALGADACASARGMMLALGCIQALRCNSNHCPVGIATQDPTLEEGLVVKEKSIRVFNFHQKTLESLAKLLGAMGVNSPTELTPSYILQRTHDGELKTLEEIYFPQGIISKTQDTASNGLTVIPTEQQLVLLNNVKELQYDK